MKRKSPDSRSNKRVYDRAHASVRFAGASLDPFEVTIALKLPPDHIHRAGEPRLERSRAGIVQEYARYREGMWCMSSERWVNSPRLAVHLDWLLKQLEPKKRAIAAILQRGVTGDLFCFSFGSTATPPSLPRTIRDRARHLGLTIDIDHYNGDANP